MADDLKISEMAELLTGGLHDDLFFEVIDLTELDVADQNKKVKLVTLEAALGAEDKIFKGTTNVTTLANSITSDIGGSERQNADLNQWLIGDAAGVHIIVDWDTGQVTLHDTSGAATFTHDDSGITLKSGATADTIETTLTNDATHIPASSAVFAAIDAISTEEISHTNTSVVCTATAIDMTVNSQGMFHATPDDAYLGKPAAARVWVNWDVGVIDLYDNANTLILRMFTDKLQFPAALLETNTGTPIDLTIDCGTGKTLKLEQPVWRDLNSSGAMLAGPGVVQPDPDKFLDEAGADTGIYTLAFDVGELVHSGFEIPHDYVEESDFSFHVHWQGIAAPSGTDNVAWELTYTISRDGETLDAVTVIQSPDAEIITQYDFVRSTFAVIDGATGGPNGGPVMIGDQFLFTLGRIAAAGDAYLGDALVATAGIHYMVDTLGSRQIGTK